MARFLQGVVYSIAVAIAYDFQQIKDSRRAYDNEFKNSSCHHL